MKKIYFFKTGVIKPQRIIFAKFNKVEDAHVQ